MDYKRALNLSVVNPGAENIGWWDYETDELWWAIRLWLRRN